MCLNLPKICALPDPLGLVCGAVEGDMGARLCGGAVAEAVWVIGFADVV